MKIYLKGYYGYQNFWDELLMFGVIEEIFSRYPVEELIIESWNPQRCQKWLQMNSDFLEDYYKSRGRKIDWNKVHFFDIDQYFQQQNKGSWTKLRTYLQILLWNHPYKNAFKIFGGGEVIDESRNFPHNWWNLLFLYFQSILKRNFALRGGLGSQKSCRTRLLTRFLAKQAKILLLRDPNSYTTALTYTNPDKVELTEDFSSSILHYYNETNSQITHQEKNNQDEQSQQSEINWQYSSSHLNSPVIINLSPTLTPDKLHVIDSYLKNELYFFPCDINFDLIYRQNYLPPHTKTYLWTEHKLTDTFAFLKKSEIWLGSRLHFLYCFKMFKKPFITLSQSNKLKYNLEHPTKD